MMFSDEGEPSDDVPTTPLWMVSQSPALTELVTLLQRSRRALDEGGGGRLELSRNLASKARAEFSEMIRRGERDLHMLAGLLADQLLGAYQMRSVVIGEIEKSSERFSLSFDVTQRDVIANTDLDLGNRVLSRLAIADGKGWRRANLVSNVVEYEAQEPNKFQVYRVLTRIKAEEEIWNKVADEIFELDRIVLRDKALRHLGRYVKDVFGIKLVVGSRDDAYRLQGELAQLRFTADKLGERELTIDDAHEKLELVEVKDYISRRSRKQSGWIAIKSVVRWGGRTFEIQVQPLSNFLHERERLTKESHSSFKLTRERVRDEIATRIPLFNFYRDLLRWLFMDPTGDAPGHVGVEVVVVE